MTAVLAPGIATLDVTDLARRQVGVVTRSQLHAVGVRDHRVRAQLDARRWQAVGPLVVVLHNGPLTAEQQRWAVVLNAGPNSALCGRTGAALDGLTGYDDGVIHVIVQRGERPPSLPGIDFSVHESRRYAPDRDIRPNRSPPRLRLERNLVSSVQQRLTVPRRLLDALRDAGRVRHRRLLRLAMDDVAGGALALSEIDFARFGRQHQLPVPIRQAVRNDPKGRRRYLDAVFTRPDGSQFAVEIDGGDPPDRRHLLGRLRTRERDRHRRSVPAPVP